MQAEPNFRAECVVTQFYGSAGVALRVGRQLENGNVTASNAATVSISQSTFLSNDAGMDGTVLVGKDGSLKLLRTEHDEPSEEKPFVAAVEPAPQVRHFPTISLSCMRV